jgi:hypothetical protein
MKGHIICEGPTDHIILERILRFSLDSNIELVKPSVTQKKNRGVSAIIDNKTLLFKFLHHSMANQVDIIIICVDNDCDTIENGIPSRSTLLKEYYDEFLQKNSRIYRHTPKKIVVVPIETIDYWIRACQLNAGPGTIRGLEHEPKEGMKKIVYGEDNVLPNGLILEDAFNQVIDQVLTEKNIQEKLIHLPSFLNLFDLIQSYQKS